MDINRKLTLDGHQSKLLDAPSLATAILAVVRGHFGVLVHVIAHVVEVVEAPLLRDPLRGLAVLCNRQSSSAFCSLACMYGLNKWDRDDRELTSMDPDRDLALVGPRTIRCILRGSDLFAG